VRNYFNNKTNSGKISAKKCNILLKKGKHINMYKAINQAHGPKHSKKFYTDIFEERWKSHHNSNGIITKTTRIVLQTSEL